MSKIQQIEGFAGLTALPCWLLEVGDCQAVVSEYGAHVLSYQVGTKPLLWLSTTAVWQDAKAIRGGIPICWPWFGPCPAVFNKTQNVQPNHGIARTRYWQVTAQEITEQSASIEFTLAKLSLPWSSELVTLVYRVELSAQALTVTLSCQEKIRQQAALHSYFTVADCRSTKVSPLPLHFYDKTTDSMQNSASDTCMFPAEVDRIYQQTAPTLTISEQDYQLNITQSGHDSSILWNPGIQKASQTADIAEHSWPQFVCVESAVLSLEETTLNLSQRIENPWHQQLEMIE